jgi:hypothetical protein
MSTTYTSVAQQQQQTNYAKAAAPPSSPPLFPELRGNADDGDAQPYTLPPPPPPPPMYHHASTGSMGDTSSAARIGAGAGLENTMTTTTTSVLNASTTSSLSATTTGSSAAAPPPTTSSEKWIWVLDPMTRKLRVPMSYLVPTQATATMGTVPSLCIAFLEGRCRHPWCRQAHVLPHMIAQLRHDALNAPTCCSKHHDPHDTVMLTKRFETITIADCSMQSPIPTECIALTVGLQRYLAHSVPNDVRGPNLEIPSKLICRLHLSHRCRYLEDCNNVHVCREFDLRLHPPPFMMAPLQNLTVTTRTVILGDASYHVTPLAVGEVTDDEFHALCEQQQLFHHRGGGGTSPVQNNTGSTSTSPFLCGVPYPDQYGRGTPEQQHGGTSPFIGSSSSPPNVQQQFAMHTAATHNSSTNLHAWGAAGTEGAIGTPTNSFSTPPLAHTRLHHQVAPGSLALGPSSFSSPPTGLPSFIGGDAPPAYTNNVAAAAAATATATGSIADLIAKFGEQYPPTGEKLAAAAASSSPFLAADSSALIHPPPLFSATVSAGPLHQTQHPNTVLNYSSSSRHGGNLAATSKTLRVYDIRGVATNSPTPSAAAPPGHHHHGGGHHHGHHHHGHHYGGGSHHYGHHHGGGGGHHHQQYGGGYHRQHHSSAASSSGVPSLQGSPVLAAAAISPLSGPHHHHHVVNHGNHGAHHYGK